MVTDFDRGTKVSVTREAFESGYCLATTEQLVLKTHPFSFIVNDIFEHNSYFFNAVFSIARPKLVCQRWVRATIRNNGRRLELRKPSNPIAWEDAGYGMGIAGPIERCERLACCVAMLFNYKRL